MIALAGDAAATPRWGVVIDRGPLRVSAEAGLARDARRVADRAERSLTRITADLPDLPRPAALDLPTLPHSPGLADAAAAGRGAHPRVARAGSPRQGGGGVAPAAGGWPRGWVFRRPSGRAIRRTGPARSRRPWARPDRWARGRRRRNGR